MVTINGALGGVCGGGGEMEDECCVLNSMSLSSLLYFLQETEVIPLPLATDVTKLTG